MAIGDTYRLTVVTGREDLPVTCVNHFYFQQANALIFDTPGQDLVAAWQNYCESTYRALFTNFLVMRRYSVGKAPSFETEHEFTFTTTVAGIGTGEPLPPRTSGLLSLRTPTLSKRGRGRNYLPPATEADNGNGKPTAAYITKMNNLGIAIMEDMPSINVLFAIWVPQMWSKADQVARPVSQIIARTSWASQRDRSGLY